MGQIYSRWPSYCSSLIWIPRESRVRSRAFLMYARKLPNPNPQGVSLKKPSSLLAQGVNRHGKLAFITIRYSSMAINLKSWKSESFNPNVLEVILLEFAYNFQGVNPLILTLPCSRIKLLVVVFLKVDLIEVKKVDLGCIVRSNIVIK